MAFHTPVCVWTGEETRSGTALLDVWCRAACRALDVVWRREVLALSACATEEAGAPVSVPPGIARSSRSGNSGSFSSAINPADSVASVSTEASLPSATEEACLVLLPATSPLLSSVSFFAASASVCLPARAVCCLYGKKKIAEGKLEELSHNLPGWVVRAGAWPLTEAELRPLIAESVVVGGSGGAALGHPLARGLAGMETRLCDNLREMYAGCVTCAAQALAGSPGDTVPEKTRYGKNGASAEVWEDGVRRAHSLKGVALSFGQLVLGEAAQRLLNAFECADASELRRWLTVVAALACPNGVDETLLLR